MTVQVISPGALTTLQDRGRYGYQHLGVSANGVMDEWSHRVANILVGNNENEATLEITLAGPALSFERAQIIAVCGADLSATLDETPIPLGRAILCRQGTRLKFGRRNSGARAYLSIRGGFEAPQVMNSKSTFLRCGFGGFSGRMLKVGDQFQSGRYQKSRAYLHLLEESTAAFVELPGPTVPALNLTTPQMVRVIPGPQWQHFTDETHQHFVESEFQITPQSDRMGYRMQGQTLQLTRPLEMISEPVSFGTIQVPPDGNPIVLMADRPTTGGYPRIGSVAAVDLPLMAQLFAPAPVKFQLVSLDEAQKLYLDREAKLAHLKATVAAQNTTINFAPDAAFVESFSATQAQPTQLL